MAVNGQQHNLNHIECYNNSLSMITIFFLDIKSFKNDFIMSYFY